MSGICGICEPGLDISREKLAPMLSALALTDESQRDALGGRSAAIGVSRRWSFQQIAHIPGVRIAVDADLCSLSESDHLLRRQGLDPAPMSVAEKLGWLYLRVGTNFFQYLDGAFCVALWDEKAERLLLAIDRLGIRSLYWSQERNRLLLKQIAVWVESWCCIRNLGTAARGRSGGIDAVFIVQCRSRTSRDLPGRSEAAARHFSEL